MKEAPLEIATGPSPTAAVIWLHGLGADGSDFVPVVHELTRQPPWPAAAAVRFVFPHAPFRPVTCNGGYVMRAWYDIYSISDLSREDAAGLEQSRQAVEALIAQEIARGIDSRRIVLMGFSQGGAVALLAGLCSAHPLAGIGALSTYLPLRERFPDLADAANARTPVLMAHGLYDPVVPLRLGAVTRDLLLARGYDVQWQEYPMEHGVCGEEIGDIAAWLAARLS
jgi:phospholipase/carboxylesterase